MTINYVALAVLYSMKVLQPATYCCHSAQVNLSIGNLIIVQMVRRAPIHSEAGSCRSGDGVGRRFSSAPAFHLLRSDMYFILLVNLKWYAIATVDLFLALRGADVVRIHTSLLFTSGATGQVAVHGAESGGSGWCVASRFAVERLQAEDALEQSPGERQVCHDNCCVRFSNIPHNPTRAVWVAETVAFAQDRREHLYYRC